jgi:single-strand DNA-binding protein
MTLPTITATGRLAADPDLSFTPSGKAVAKFRMACDKNRKNDQGQWEKVSTTWLAVDTWGDDAETVAHNLQKGDMVTVVGNLNVREYEKDGTKRLSVEIENGRVSKALPKAKNGTGAPIQQSTSNPWDQQGGGSAWGASEQAPF